MLQMYLTFMLAAQQVQAGEVAVSARAITSVSTSFPFIVVAQLILTGP
jgi:hypothetical protein